MTEANPLVFYDISSPLAPRSYAPNPSKSRLALSFKRVPFTTTWVDIPDIATVRKSLDCPPVRKLDDGSDYYTLPMLRDPSSGNKVIGDSFDIAIYLEDNFPDCGGKLFPANSTRTGLDYESPHKDTVFLVPLTNLEGRKNEDYAKFNMHVDATFTAYVGLVGEFLPFNPESAEAVRAMFAKRAHLKSWDELSIKGEAREKLTAAFKDGLATLAEKFKVHEAGPFLEGATPNYADFIVGGWLVMMSVTMPKAEWKDFKTWHDGVFGKLHDALQADYFECK